MINNKKTKEYEDYDLPQRPVKYKQYKDDWSKEKYEAESETLANTPCDYKNILGYIQQDNKTKNLSYVKYNKTTELFITYMVINANPSIISYTKKSWRDFESGKYGIDFGYYDEIPKGM